MQNKGFLRTKLYLWAVILVLVVLDLRSLNVTTPTAAHESNPSWRTGAVDDHPLVTPAARKKSTPQVRTRGENSSWSLTQTSNMLAVQLLSYTMPPRNVGPLAVVGHYAYVSEISDIDIFDVSNPVSPTLVNIYQTGEGVYGVVGMIISGTVAYVAYSSSDLLVLDISQPMSPTLVGFYDGVGYAGYAGMQRIKNYLYLTTTSCSLLIIDVATDSNPVEVGCWHDVPNINALYVDDRYAYVAQSLGSPSIVHILDISNPISPTVINSYPGPWPVSSIVSTGDYLYIANLQGFYVVDISSPSNLQTVTFYPVNGSADAHIVGPYMYLAVGAGVLILDISDPVSPTPVGQGALPSSGAYLAVVGQHVYMTDVNVWGWGIKFAGGLGIFEVHELTNQIYLPIVRR